MGNRNGIVSLTDACEWFLLYQYFSEANLQCLNNFMHVSSIAYMFYVVWIFAIIFCERQITQEKKLLIIFVTFCYRRSCIKNSFCPFLAITWTVSTHLALDCECEFLKINSCSFSMDTLFRRIPFLWEFWRRRFVSKFSVLRERSRVRWELTSCPDDKLIRGASMTNNVALSRNSFRVRCSFLLTFY